MATEINLKNKNVIPLWLLFVFNVLVLLISYLSIHLDTFLNNYKALITFRSSGILIAPVVLFIILGLLSSNQKAFLVFWRFKDILPGCRAFTLHALNDPRVNMKRLEMLHGPLPTAGRDQNQLWYKIYKKHSSDLVIMKSHKDFLLARDMSAISFLFLIFAGFPMLYFGKSPNSYFYLIFLFVQYLIFVRIAQNHGKRFVTNVLALESTY